MGNKFKRKREMDTTTRRFLARSWTVIRVSNWAKG